jgi:hypothetical protein
MAETIADIAERRKRWVDANRENNFEAGIKRLLTDLYPDNAHFVYELLQNAEDARARTVRFILQEDRVEFEHDGERLFTIRDVDAITSIGFSTKRDDATNIGKFGVGFKAVFAYTNSPEIESGEFRFRIKDLVVPESISSGKPETSERLTRFILPFDNPKKPAECARTEIARLLKALDATTLLFLSNIVKIEYLLIDSTLGYIQRIPHANNRFQIQVQQPDESEVSSAWFIRFDRSVEVEDDEAESDGTRIKSCRIAVAFGLVPSITEPIDSGDIDAQAPQNEWELTPLLPGRTCIYFPAEKTSNLRFHLHAPFASTVARDSVRDCAGNLLLRDHVAELLAEAMHSLRDQGLLTVRALAVLPNEKDNLGIFYQPLRRRLVEEFMEEDLTPMKSGEHAAASGIFRGSKNVTSLIDDFDLAVLMGDDYYPPMWVANPMQLNQREDEFLSMLRIEKWTEKDLAEKLLAMKTETLHQWLTDKHEEWHQRLYALLGDYLTGLSSWQCPDADDLSSVQFVRMGDGTYRSGDAKCYFPSEDIEYDSRMPRVSKEVYLSGKSKQQQQKARSFLEAIGVRDVGEKEEIEFLLEQHYTVNGHKPAIKRHVMHIRRFIEFSSQHPAELSIFKPYQIVLDAEGCWRRVSNIFLDDPYCKSGLALFYRTVGTGTFHAIGDIYKKSGVSTERLLRFLTALGAQTSLSIDRQAVGSSHPDERYLLEYWRIRGVRQTGSAVDFDWTISRLDKLLSSPSIDIARLLWKTMSSAGEQVLKARYRPNQKYEIREAPSTIVHKLKSHPWIPQKGNFLLPSDACVEDLPDGFPYDSGAKWLRAIGFGEAAAQRSADYRKRKEIARELGFEDDVALKQAERFARLDADAREVLLREYESRAERDLPASEPADPERRQQRVRDEATKAPKRTTAQRSRSVSLGLGAVKEEAKAYLRRMYTIDGEMICQVCQNVLPFRLADGSHFFEAVEFLRGLERRYDQNYLALCPNHAAMYQYASEAAEFSEDKVIDGRLPIILAGEKHSVYFTQNHILDLAALQKAELEEMQDDAEEEAVGS